MSIIRDVTVKALKYLDIESILIFVGARQSGKTTILKQIQSKLEASKETCFFLNLEDPEYLGLLNEHPRNLLKIFSFDLSRDKKYFVFVDEIQYLKDPSNFLKFIFDEYKEKIKLIVSGSSAFYIDKKFKDSLAGRKKIFNVHTLSFREFLRFKKEDILSQKSFKEISLEEENKIDLYYREFIVYGGYPRVVLSPVEEKENIIKELAYSYIKKDIYEAGIKKEDVFYKLFKILSDQVGNLVNTSELANTLNVSKTAINNYLETMRKSFHIALISPFSKNLRKEISKMPKVFFYDLGLRNFFFGSFESFETRDDKGRLLENAVFRQLIEKHENDQIKFWRTSAQNEVDFVVDEKKAYEVKVNINQFKKSKYKSFLESYPDIDFSLISFNSKDVVKEDFAIRNVWEI
ncbi:MAG TPA: ATP-binding protein [Candidatus Kaiserbacteria bacterium]|nr:ATP-binding protein [Candidatus Kaiserbacteria bacterium]